MEIKRSISHACCEHEIKHMENAITPTCIIIYWALTVDRDCAKTFTVRTSGLQTTYERSPVATCYPDERGRQSDLKRFIQGQHCSEVRNCEGLRTWRSGLGVAPPYPLCVVSDTRKTDQHREGVTDDSLSFPPSAFTISVEHELSLFQQSFVTCCC